MQMRSWTLKKMVKYLGEGRKAASEKEEKKKEERKKKRRTERREGHTVLKRTVLKEGGKKRNFLAGKRNFWREKFCSLFSETCSLFGKKKGKKKRKEKKEKLFSSPHSHPDTTPRHLDFSGFFLFIVQTKRDKIKDASNHFQISISCPSSSPSLWLSPSPLAPSSTAQELRAAPLLLVLAFWAEALSLAVTKRLTSAVASWPLSRL